MTRLIRPVHWVSYLPLLFALLGCTRDAANTSETDKALYLKYRRAIAMDKRDSTLWAIDTVQATIRMGQGKASDTLMAKLTYQLGAYQKKLGAMGQSLETSKEGYAKIWGPPYDSVRLVHAGKFLNSIGATYSALAMNDSAEYYLRRAIYLREYVFGPVSEEATMPISNLGTVFQNREEYARADSCFNLVLRRRRKMPDSPPAILGNAFLNYGENKMRAGHFREAEPLLQRAIGWYAADTTPFSRQRAAMTYDALAKNAFQMGDTALAIARHTEALERAAAAFPIRDREYGKILCGYADLMLQAGRPEPALRASHAALLQFLPAFHDTVPTSSPVHYQLNREPWALVALCLKAYAWDRIGGKAAEARADASFQLAFQFADHIRQGFGSLEQKTMLVELVNPKYEDAIAMSFRRGDCPRVFEWMERSKANDLLDELIALDKLGARRLPDTILDQGKYLEYKAAKAYAEMQQGDPQAEERFFRYQDSLQKLHDYTIRRFPNHFLSPERFADLPTLKDSLKGAMFISYFQGQHNLYALAATAGEDTCIQIPLTSSLRADLDQVTQLDTPDTGLFWQTTGALSRIYETLLKPVFALVKGKIPGRLLIVPDGHVVFLPFDALLTHPVDSTGIAYGGLPFLIKSTTISYVNSASIFLRLRKMKPTTDPGVYGMGTSEKIGPARSLPNAADEVLDAVGTMGGMAMLNRAASEEALKRRKDFRQILHLASHGQVDYQFPMRSKILLHSSSQSGEDGNLHAYEIFDLQIPERLAVLSACQTGLGHPMPGQGVMSVAYSFQLAGCPSVVMTLWNINDHETKDIMARFYGQLRIGLTTAEALRQARLQYLEDNPSHAMPYYWAPYVIVGDADLKFVSGHLDNDPEWSRCAATIACLAIVTIALSWIYIRHRKRRFRWT